MYILSSELVFPSVSKTHSSGIIAIGGDLSVERLLLAYSRGIFPWYEDGEPITWWCPDSRMVVFPKTFKIKKSLRNILNRGLFTVTMNKAFDQVIRSCQSVKRKGQGSTWITDEMLTAYTRLYSLGKVLSVEVWFDGSLVGGLYGVDLGDVFCGESMFSTVPNASKVAFVTLVNHLKTHEYKLLDCQVYNDHLALLGAVEISRESFMDILNRPVS